MAVLNGSLGHITRAYQQLDGSLGHTTDLVKTVDGSLGHRADLSKFIRGSLGHISGTGNVLDGPIGHSVPIGKEPDKSTVLPLSPELGTPYVPVDPQNVPGLFNINLLTLFKPWARLVGGPTAKLASWSLQEKVNAGWTGDCTLLGSHDIEFDQYDELRIVSSDGRGGELVSPPLIAERRAVRESLSGPTTSFGLMDATSFRLSQSGRSLDTFVRVSASKIVEGIATEWGVRITGAPDFNVLEEDIKDSDGMSALLRLAAVNASALLIDKHGTLRFVDNQHRGNAVKFRCREIERSYTPSISFTGFSAVKTSSIPGSGVQEYTFTQEGYASFQLRSPLRNPIGNPRGGSGGLGYLAFWSGPPSSPESKVVRFQLLGQSAVALSVPIDRLAVATHATVKVYPNSVTPLAPVSTTLWVTGAAPEPDLEGTDRAFVVHYGTGRRTQIWREQMLPSKEFVEARLSRYLWEASKDSRSLEYSGAADYSVRACTELVRSGVPSNRAQEVKHSGSAGQVPMTEVKAVIL